MDNSPQNTDDLAKAAQITVVFILLYSLTFVNVLVNKKRLLGQARADKKKFDRYTSPQMLPADRLQANFLEWSPIFLGLLWSLAATANLSKGSSVAVAQIYVGLRALYIVLLLRYGVGSNGMSKPLMISTFPAYICLLYLGKQAVRLLLLQVD
jgi:uncharacterized MAPEG superfamily protein